MEADQRRWQHAQATDVKGDSLSAQTQEHMVNDGQSLSQPSTTFATLLSQEANQPVGKKEEVKEKYNSEKGQNVIAKLMSSLEQMEERIK